MKTYATWEVMKMLEENPKLKFESKEVFENSAPSIVRIFVGENDYIELETENCSDEISGNIPINGKWTLIQQSVTFIEAIKAYHEGKTISCKTENHEMVWNDGYFKFDETHGRDLPYLTTRQVLEGKWYIESEEE